MIWNTQRERRIALTAGVEDLCRASLDRDGGSFVNVDPITVTIAVDAEAMHGEARTELVDSVLAVPQGACEKSMGLSKDSGVSG